MTSDQAARAFLGIPFRHQGRDPLIGIDCIGLIVLWGQLLDLPFVALDSPNYGVDPAHGLLESYLEQAFGKPLPVSAIEAGTIVSMDYFGATRHVGIVANHPQGGLSLIHTNQRVGCVTEARIDDKWLKRIRGVYRVR